VASVQVGEYRDVVVFSGARPEYKQPPPGGTHRGRQGEERRDFSIHDPEGGVTYHAGCTTTAYPRPGSPRHHHSFDQIRFVISGEVEYGGKRFGGGWLGYFPEGVFYGPEAQTEAGTFVVMQFPGLSGSPFHSRADTARATVMVREAGGVFEDGLCIWPDGRKQDAHEALMEALYDKQMEYPPARYSEQVWINSENFDWEPSEIPGVSVRRLAHFHSRGPAIQMIKLEPGASIPGGTSGAFMIRYIFEGEAEYGGRPCPAISNLYYPPEAPYRELGSATGATILSIELQAQYAGSPPPLPYRL
jgi:hypothetical protein